MNNEEFNQPSQSFNSFHGQEFISSYQKDSKEKACDFLSSMRHAVAKI